MASIVLGVIGAGIGAFYGGPQGAALGWSVGVTLGGVVFPPKLEAQQRGRIDDLRVTGSGYGAVIPQLWGRSRLAGNIIWARDLVEQKRKEEVGSKGGPTQTVTTYSYFGIFAVAICQGPIEAVEKIWAEDVLIYNAEDSPVTRLDITVYLGDEEQEPDPLMESFEGSGNVPAYRGLAYAVFNMIALKRWGNRIPSLTFQVRTGEETVATVIEGLFEQAGLTPDQYDVSEVEEKAVEGFVVQTRSDVAGLLSPLLIAYQSDMSEYDGKIHVIPRGGAVDLTIPEDDLGTDFWQGDSVDNPAPKIDVKRIQDIELPVSVEVTYFDVDKNYQTGSQRAVRYTKGHVDERLTFTVPLTLNKNSARRIAETELYRQWIEREQQKISLPPKYLRVVPGSVLNLPIAGSEVRCRVVSVDSALFGPLEVALVRDDTEILNQTIEGASLGEIDESLVNPLTIEFLVFCCNALRDEDANSPGYYVAAAGQDSWEGVSLYRRRGGNAYRKFGEIIDSVTYGEALTALAPGVSTGTVDYTNTVDIDLITGSIESTSLDDILAGANFALLGNEVIAFTTVTALGGSSYRLSGLLRGKRGTDYAWGDHVIGDRFILLEVGTVQRIDVGRGLINKSMDFKAVTESQVLGDVSPVSVTITGQELKPYSPVSIAGDRNPISDDLTITWLRRARKSAEWQDLSDIELDELHERYKVEIWTPGWVTLKRTYTVSSATALYSAAHQITDFGSTQAEVYVKVYQYGDFVSGPTTHRQTGYPGSAVV